MVLKVFDAVLVIRSSAGMGRWCVRTCMCLKLVRAFCRCRDIRPCCCRDGGRLT